MVNDNVDHLVLKASTESPIKQKEMLAIENEK